MTSRTKTIALFPGQGSQKVGMGKALFEDSPVAQDILHAADQALGFSLSKVILEGPELELTRTDIAQPAILTVSVACFEATRSMLEDRFEICAAAGHSLGEYSALVAAGALNFSDAVKLVNKRGQYMQTAVPVGHGKMVAVLGKELSDIEVATNQVTSGVAQVANINAPGQIVVAGDVQGVNAFVAALGKARVVELQVSAPFHCSLMKPAEDKLWEDLKQIKIMAPKFDIFSNYWAKPLRAPEEIREALRLQVCGRVKWLESMQQMSAQYQPEAALEFGEGEVLTNMLKRINPELRRINVNGLECLSNLS